jgi:hypothetical protein
MLVWEDHRLRVFENRVLRRTCGPKRDEVTGELMKLQRAELHNYYSSSNIIRQIQPTRISVGWECGTHGRGGELYKCSVEHPDGR